MTENQSPPVTDFAAFYAEQWPQAVRLARLMTGSTTAAEEVAQEAFLGLVTRFARVDNPRAYLRRSLTNAAISFRRRRSNHVALDEEHDIPVLPAEYDDTWRALRVLTERQRAIVVLRFYADLPLHEIAEVAGCSLGTVKSTLSRSMDRLRKELS